MHGFQEPSHSLSLAYKDGFHLERKASGCSIEHRFAILCAWRPFCTQSARFCTQRYPSQKMRDDCTHGGDYHNNDSMKQCQSGIRIACQISHRLFSMTGELICCLDLLEPPNSTCHTHLLSCPLIHGQQQIRAIYAMRTDFNACPKSFQKWQASGLPPFAKRICDAAPLQACDDNKSFAHHSA